MSILFTLNMYDVEGKVKTYRSFKKRRILARLQARNWESATIVVVYTGDDGKRIGANRFICSNIEEARQALEVAVEPELLGFVRDNNAN